MKKIIRVLILVSFIVMTFLMVGCLEARRTFYPYESSDNVVDDSTDISMEVALKPDRGPKDRGFKSECKVIDSNGDGVRSIEIKDINIVGLTDNGYFNANEDTSRIGFKDAVGASGSINEFLSGLQIDNIGISNSEGNITKSESEVIVENGKDKTIQVDLGCTIVRDLIKGKEVQFWEEKLKGTFQKAGIAFSADRAIKVIGMLNEETLVENIHSNAAIKVISATGVNLENGSSSQYSGYLVDIDFKTVSQVSSTEYDDEAKAKAKVNASILKKVVIYFKSDEDIQYSPNFLDQINLQTGELLKETSWDSLNPDGIATSLSISY